MNLLPNELLIEIFRNDVRNHGWETICETDCAPLHIQYLTYLRNRSMNGRLWAVAREAWWQTFVADCFMILTSKASGVANI